MGRNGIEPVNNILKREIAKGYPYGNPGCLTVGFVRTGAGIDSFRQEDQTAPRRLNIALRSHARNRADSNLERKVLD